MILTALLLFVSADLSSYRQFKFGMDLPAAAAISGLTHLVSKVVARRPALIETLEWQPQRAASRDPVENVILTFYNNQLFRMVINYQRLRTEGMTNQDMIDSISSVYGTATSPNVEIALPSYNSEAVKVLARWETADYSFDLVHSFMATYALIGSSKLLAGPALAAISEAHRLDVEEAPGMELARNAREVDDAKTALEKARTGNKAGFRP